MTNRSPDIPDDLPALRLPAPGDLRVRAAAGRPDVFDPVRSRWVALTPEEWVRQHVIAWLTASIGVPRGLLAVERELRWQDTRRRADIVAYDRHGAPWMIVECKAPGVALGREARAQAGRYLSATGASFVVVTNGMQTVGWRVGDDGSPAVLHEMPAYPSE